MQPIRGLAALQRAAQQALVHRDLRVAGIAGSIFGVLALLAAVMPPADPVLFAVGAIITVAALWNLTNPHPTGIILAGISLMIVGGYNITSGMLAAFAGRNPSVFWQVLGFWQIVWGAQRLPRYRRFAGAFDTPCPPEERKSAWAMIADLRRANTRKRDDVVQLDVLGWMPMPLLIRLMPDGALCLVGADVDVRVVPREQISMQVMQEARFGRAYRVRMRLADRILVAIVRKDLHQRFEAWKGDAAEMPEAMAA